MDNIQNSDYFEKLYLFQNRVLTIAFAGDTNFYLSGGTPLNRYLLPWDNDDDYPRHSDDLDFFMNLEDAEESYDYFHQAKEEVISRIKYYYKVESESSINAYFEYCIFSREDYIYYVYDKNVRLKIQFVLDRRKKSDTHLIHIDRIKLDNLHNILTNKISTIQYRDEFKDFVDLYNIAKFDKSIDWSSVIKETKVSLKISKEDSLNFKERCLESLKKYHDLGASELIKVVNFGKDEAYQIKKVEEVLDRFKETIIDKL